jgi:hypothetical protein
VLLRGCLNGLFRCGNRFYDENSDTFVVLNIFATILYLLDQLPIVLISVPKLGLMLSTNASVPWLCPTLRPLGRSTIARYSR